MSEKNKYAPVLRRKKSNLVGNQYRRRSRPTLSDQYQAKLTHVLGLTLKNNCSFTCDPSSGLLAYPAGCVIVLFNPRTEKQSHILNPGHKTLTCMRFNEDGTLIVTGESGHQPCVRIFSVQDKSQVNYFTSHKFGISCVAFSPNSKYAISIGHQHDMLINVWDLKRNTLAASNKVSTKIKAVAFSEDSSYFVTVGNRLVKFWYLDNSSGSDKTPFPLKGRPALLETLQNHLFCDVVCAVGVELTFAITKSGILCQFNEKRIIKKHIQLECRSAQCLAIFEGLLLCGCAQGCIHMYELETLDFIKEITPPTELGSSKNEILAMTVDIRNFWLHCAYADHSVLVYDMMDQHNPDLSYLSQYHNACVSDVKMLPYTSECTSLPTDCFITCSSDGTARAWTYTNTYKLLKIIKLEESGEQMNGSTEVDGLKTEARCLCIRNDGKHLAVGDKAGNIHIFDLETFEKVSFIPTHEGDVLCLDYISPPGGMLASSSRDRCVHTFVGDGYAPTHTITDHSAAVYSIKFARKDSKVRLITCGLDKSLYFCGVTTNPSSGKVGITREQHIVEKNSMVDMCVLDDSVLVACGSFLREYELGGGKLKRSFRGSETTQPLLRVTVDDQRTMIATSCSDKKIYIIGFMTTEFMCTLSGHSENVVSLAFDLHNHLLSASADSCIFVWELNHRVAIDIKSLSNIAPSSALTTPETDLNKTDYFGEVESTDDLIEAGFQCSPRNQTSELVSVDPEDLAYPLEMEVSSNLSSELPSWVLNQVKSEDVLFNEGKSASSLGSWGNGLHQDEICEQLGKLASDQVSVMSFVEDLEHSDTDDHTDTDSSSEEGEFAMSLADEIKVFEENSSIIDSISKEINLSLEEINQRSTEESSKHPELPEKPSKVDKTSDLDLLPVKEGVPTVKPVEILDDSLNGENKGDLLSLEGKNDGNLLNMEVGHGGISQLNKENLQKSSIVNEEKVCGDLNHKNSEKTLIKKDNLVDKKECPELNKENLGPNDLVESDTLNTNTEVEKKGFENSGNASKPDAKILDETFIIQPEIELKDTVLTLPDMAISESNSNQDLILATKTNKAVSSENISNEKQTSELNSKTQSNQSISSDVSPNSNANQVETGINQLDLVLSNSNHLETATSIHTSKDNLVKSGSNQFESSFEGNDEYVDMRGHHYNRPEILASKHQENQQILSNGEIGSNNTEDVQVSASLFERAIDDTCETVVNEAVTSAKNECLNEIASNSDERIITNPSASKSNQQRKPRFENETLSDQTIHTSPTSQVPNIDQHKIEDVLQNGDPHTVNRDIIINDNFTFNHGQKTSKPNYLQSEIPEITENGVKAPVENGFADQQTDLPTKPAGISLPTTPMHTKQSKFELSRTDPRKITENPTSDNKFLTPKSNKNSKGDNNVIHPGFAELLASLTKLKTRRSPARSVPARKSHQVEEIKSRNLNGVLESGDHSFKDRFVGRNTGYSNRNTSLESNTSSMSSNSSGSCDNYYSVLADCQKASQALLTSFNQAKAIYHKQKAQADIDPDYTDNNNSVKKLVSTFRAIHQGISDMELVDSDLPARPSLNTLKDDSPGMFLLREYSELLFDMIKNRVEAKVVSRDNDI